MAIAGKVAITLSTENGGAWSADVTYDRLVAVKHNNNLYISRKTVANVEPPNDEFWFLSLEGFGGDDVQALIDRMNELSELIQEIIDGTTQVGNAKTLDGHGAEYFASSEVLNSVGILEKALTIEIGVYNYHFGNNSITSDLPNGNYMWGSATVFVRQKAGAVYVVLGGIKTTNINCPPTFNYYNGAEWSGWVDLFTAKGGTIGDGTRQTPVSYRGTSTVYTKYEKSDGTLLGHFGFGGLNKPVYQGSDNVARELFHTGNKPTGTYTGNGSATERTIETGGIGHFINIYSAKGTVRLSPTGGTVQASSTVKAITSGEGKFDGGKITIKTAESYLNESGITYVWEVE